MQRDGQPFVRPILSEKTDVNTKTSPIEGIHSRKAVHTQQNRHYVPMRHQPPTHLVIQYGSVRLNIEPTACVRSKPLDRIPYCQKVKQRLSAHKPHENRVKAATFRQRSKFAFYQPRRKLRRHVLRVAKRLVAISARKITSPRYEKSNGLFATRNLSAGWIGEGHHLRGLHCPHCFQHVLFEKESQ